MSSDNQKSACPISNGLLAMAGSVFGKGTKPGTIRVRLLGPFVLAIALLIVAFAVTTRQMGERRIMAESQEKFSSIPNMLQAELDQEARALEIALGAIVRNDEMRSAFLAKDRDRLLELTQGMFGRLRSQYGVTHFYFHGLKRVNFLRLYSPNRYGDTINRQTVIQAERTGEIAKGIELGKMGTFTLRVVQPWYDGEELIGYIELGEEIDHVVRLLKASSGLEFYVAIHKNLVDRQRWQEGMEMLGRQANWNQYPHTVIVDKTFESLQPAIHDHMEGGRHMHDMAEQEVHHLGRDYRITFHALLDISQHDVGDLIILHDVTAAKKALASTIYIGILLFLALGIGLGIFFYRYLGRVDRTFCEQTDNISAVNDQLEGAIGKANLLAEDAAFASASKSEFLANMSHEIRTPLTAILGYADLLQDLDIAEDQRREYLATVQSNGEHLLQLINDILDLSKIESGQLVLEDGPCNVLEVVASVLSMMRVRAEQQGISLEAEFRGPLPETIRADEYRIRQMLINLVGNSIKFTHVGGVRMVTSFVPDGLDGEPAVCIEVMDTGIGMPKHVADRLGEPFLQADASTTRVYGGTGLGMAITKRIIDAMEGDLSVSSTQREGTTFCITIPTGSLDDVKMLEKPDEAISINYDRSDAAGQAISLEGIRVLLAEDNLVNQRLIAKMLEKAGASPTTVGNGRLAVNKATDEGEGFDVILMDMQMPIMDGFEATRSLRKSGYRGAIVAITASAFNHDRDRCLEAGCDDFLPKPIDRRHLIEIVFQYSQANAEVSV